MISFRGDSDQFTNDIYNPIESNYCVTKFENKPAISSISDLAFGLDRITSTHPELTRGSRIMLSTHPYPVSGAGLGLRRSMLDSIKAADPNQINFFEVAPENWMNVGGTLGKKFRYFTERHPFVTHGLSLSVGGPHPLNESFLVDLKKFLDHHDIRFYTEHLSYTGDDGMLYDLMPIPFTDEAAHYVAERIKRVQEILERQIGIENVSYYAAPGQEITEIDFIHKVLEQADCKLLLDINNIYVNSINQKYDAEHFLKSMPKDRVVYFHVAGHYEEAEDLRVDTHGADVVDPVWELLGKAYDHFGQIPTLLERDFNIPPLPELLNEIETIHKLQQNSSRAAA